MLDSRSPEAAKRSAASKQPSRPARADDASTSTTPRSTPSAAGGDTSPKKAPTSPDPHRCFSTRTTGRQHPTRSHSSSPGPFSQTDLPYIRFHDLRHTHASLLVAAGVPIKVVSERLGHAHPGFTMHTYQHILPGMGAGAARKFAQLIDTAGR